MDIKKTLVLDSADPVSKAASFLKDSPAVIVTRQGKYYGIIDHASMDLGLKDLSGMKCETLIIKPPVIKGKADLMERMDSFLVGHFKALPVVDEREVPIGITTRVELLSDLMKGGLVPKQEVAELMNAPVFTIGEGETVARAKALLKEKNARRLVVLNAAGSPMGVISNFDISQWNSLSKLSSGRKDAGIAQKDRVDLMPIKGFLRPDITTIAQEGSIEEAARKMIAKEVSHVIVVSDKKAVGVLSALDVFRRVREDAEEGIAISISGLGEDNKAEYDTLRGKTLKVLEKFKNSFEIRNVSLHVKEEKSNFTLNLYLETNEGRLALKEERPTLKEGMDRIADELDVLLTKKKEMRKAKPRACKSGSRVRE